MQIRDVLMVVVLCGSLGFWAGGSWAEETAPPSTTEEVELTPEQLDEIASSSVVNTPRITYSLVEEGFHITVHGIPLREVTDYTLNGQVISAEMKQLADQGIIEVVKSDDDHKIGFVLAVKLEPTSVMGSEFGVILANGTKLSSIISELKPDDKGLSLKDRIMVKGYVYERDPSCLFWRCWRTTGNAYVELSKQGKSGPVRIYPMVSVASHGYYEGQIDGYCGTVYAQARSLDGRKKSKMDHATVWTDCWPTINDQRIDLYLE
jgi:hypothetical protein